MREIENLEKKIIHSAIQVFIENGYDKAKMQEIAEVAGISRTNLNYYYRTKENLFSNIVDQLFDSIIPRFVHILDDTRLPFADKIYKLVDTYSDFLQNNRNIPFFIISEINRNPQLILEFFSNNKKLNDYLIKLRRIIQKEHDNLDHIPLFKKPMVEIVSLLYGIIFLPYINLPLIKELYYGDEVELNKFLKSHAENVKFILMKILN